MYDWYNFFHQHPLKIWGETQPKNLGTRTSHEALNRKKSARNWHRDLTCYLFHSMTISWFFINMFAVHYRVRSCFRHPWRDELWALELSDPENFNQQDRELKIQDGLSKNQNHRNQRVHAHPNGRDFKGSQALSCWWSGSVHNLHQCYILSFEQDLS